MSNSEYTMDEKTLAVACEPYIPEKTKTNQYVLTVSRATTVEPHTTAIVKTGLKVKMPAQIFGRVTKNSNHKFVIGGGVIDSGYRDEIGIIVINNTDKAMAFEANDNIAFLAFFLIAKLDIDKIDPQASFTDNQTMQVKKLDVDAVYPKTAYAGDAGYDLSTPVEIELASGSSYTFSTNMLMKIPDVCIGVIYPRSGLSYKRGILASGIVAPGRENEVVVTITNHSSQNVTIDKFERIGQIVIHYFSFLQLAPVLIKQSVNDDSERGQRGFGSSG